MTVRQGFKARVKKPLFADLLLNVCLDVATGVVANAADGQLPTEAEAHFRLARRMVEAAFGACGDKLRRHTWCVLNMTCTFSSVQRCSIRRNPSSSQSGRTSSISDAASRGKRPTAGQADNE